VNGRGIGELDVLGDVASGQDHGLTTPGNGNRERLLMAHWTSAG
jgi:hypothetical protein